MFKVGDRVKINEDVWTYGNQHSLFSTSETDLLYGTVTEGVERGSSWLRIKWDFGLSDNYQEKDIILIQKYIQEDLDV